MSSRTRIAETARELKVQLVKHLLAGQWATGRAVVCS